MTDHADLAVDIDDRERQRHADAMRRKPTGIGRAACIDCGDEIPQPRRQAVPGVTRCAQCQHDEERRLQRQGIRP